MRPLLKYLPLLLTLLVPLALLAWFGSRELTRLEDHAASLLQAEAHRFLRNEEEKVRDEIERVADVSLNREIGKLLSEPRSIAEAAKELSSKPFILNVFVAADDYRLVAPRPPQAERPSAPLAAFPEDQDGEQRELWTAEILRSFHDDVGAIEALKSYIARFKDSSRHTEGLTWAYFHLAGLLSKAPPNPDDPDAVFVNYFAAQVAADQTCQRQPTVDAATVILLTKLREHQILADPEKMLGLLRQISSGRQDYMEYIPEDVIEWIVSDIAQHHIPTADPQVVARRDELLALNRVRAGQRRFADDYESGARAQLALDHRSGRLHTYKNVLFQTLTTSQGAGLLVLRPARPEERRRYPGGAFVGLLLDLPALIGSTPRSTPGNVDLQVLDPTGASLLEHQPAILSEPRATAAIRFTPVISRLARLEFVAVPITHPSDIQSAARNQGILVLILVVIALAGAFMLIRSVKRETELAQTKVNLLSRVSHELKTPLAVIKMYGETLGLGRTTDQTQVSRFAGIISSEADRLTSMVERILDFSKMEAGTFTYDKEQIDLGEVVDAVTEEYLPHIESQGLHLTRDICHGLAAFADPRGLAGSLVSLLENALKYTPEDAPERTLDVSLSRQNGCAVLEVRDRGVGIPHHELDRVFTDFYRASNAGEVRGAGIGLSIVDHFARAHQGKVEALARPDGPGTTMRLTLPLSAPDSAHTQS